MPRRSKTIAGILVGSCLLYIGSWLTAQNPAPASNRAQSESKQIERTPLPPDVDPADPALPLWLRNVSIPAAKPSPSPVATPSQVPLGEVTRSGSGYVLKVRSDEVTLQATVIDRGKRLAMGLDQSNFAVFEDDVQQRIISFTHEDIPVSMGILVDNSGSMVTKRSAVTKAVVNLVQASNPGDEVFIVNFDDEPWLDMDFTNKIESMREALDHQSTRGGTALYDAVSAAAEHLAKGAQREKKVLLVVTDGEDNESHVSLEQCIRAVQSDNGPTIYAIGILGSEGGQRRAKRALEALTTQTGGVAFFPKNLEQVDEVSQEVARDIRSQYRITYKPTNPRINGGFRHVRVETRGSNSRDLTVRTRSGYFATDEKTASVPTKPASKKQESKKQ